MNAELTRKIREQMASHQFILSIMGSLNQEFLKSLIKLTDNKLSTLDINESLKKRIFHFMVECAQNLCKVDEDETHYSKSLFLIGKNGNEYVVYLGSVFERDDSVNVINLINNVNTMSRPDLKEQLYLEMSKNKSQQNSILMSLLDLSKRTKEKIQYEDFEIAANTRFLSFKVTFPTYRA